MSEATGRVEAAGVAPPAGRPRALSILGVALIAAAVVLPAFLGNSYWLGVATNAAVYACLALGLNVAVGFAGLLDLGYAAFVAFGAYSWAIAAVRYDLTLIEAAPLVLAMAVLGALVIALPTLRLRGDYLAIVTLTFGAGVAVVLNNLTVTGGAQGIYDIPPVTLPWFALDTPPRVYAGFCVTLAVFVLFTLWLRRSRLGLRFLAIQGDVEAAEGAGIVTYRHKVYAYLIGSVLAAVVGVQYASGLSAISPPSFRVHLSILIVMAVIMGGQGGIAGPVLGGVLVVLVPELLRDWSTYRFLVFGVLLVALVLTRPQGLLPPRRPRARERRRPPWRRAGKSASVPVVADPRAPELYVEGLSVRYGGVRAVDDVTFRLAAGPPEIFGVIGPNGAGKTSLFNGISGYAPVAAGDVRLDGVRLVGRRPSGVSGAGIRRTFQNNRLFPNLSVRENLTVALPRAEDSQEARVDELLSFVGLSAEVKDALPGQLSYGQQKRLEIARALAGRPRVALLDEPSTGLNSVEKEEIARVIRSIPRLGAHCVLIDHDVSLVSQVCDRVMCLDFGRTIAMGTAQEVIAHPAVVRAYLGTAHTPSGVGREEH